MMETDNLPVDIKLYLPLLTELMFESPIKRNGSKLTQLLSLSTEHIMQFHR